MNYETNPEIISYWNHLGGIPSFLNDYLKLDIMIRLKKVGYFCGMDYASKKVYDFKYYVSRYDHSITTALITYHCSKSKRATIAALLHDVSTPIFSHVIDYMKKDFINQETTEQKQEFILANDKNLQKLLKRDNLSLEDINHKNYSIVDNERPKLCADRLDGILTPGLVWAQTIKIQDIYLIIDSLTVYKNEEQELEIGFTDSNIAHKVIEISDTINEYTHTDADTIWMLKLADISKYLLDNELITEEDLYILDEYQVIDIINSSTDKILQKMWIEFKNGTAGKLENRIPIKDRIISPLAQNTRIIHK